MFVLNPIYILRKQSQVSFTFIGRLILTWLYLHLTARQKARPYGKQWINNITLFILLYLGIVQTHKQYDS